MPTVELTESTAPKGLEKLLGPRTPSHEFERRSWRYLSPALALGLARLALIVSIFLPYWKMDLTAPQYPDGLHVEAYLDRMTGDVREIDSLNHYIGMRPLEEAAQLERKLSIWALLALAILLELAVYIHSKWAALIALPAILFPAIFLADLRYWLHDFGTNLDPTASMSNAIEPFKPPVLGQGTIGQFGTQASMGPGLQLAIAAAVLTIIGLVLHRRAFRPLVTRTRDEV